MSSQLELPSHLVKRGYWVNRSHGPIMGQTITTDAKTGGVIVALLAVITSLGMTHLWHLLTFIYHQTRAKGRPRDGLFRHQQAMLRTLPTPSALIAESTKLWLAWRRVSDKALSRSIGHISVALIFVIGSLAASIFSSSIVTSSNLEVLVKSGNCGRFSDNASVPLSYKANLSAGAETYARDCYPPNFMPSRCNVFIRPSIPFKSEMVQCPFQDKICRTQGLSLDSGLLDLNDAFGLNLADADRLQYRRKSVCAVLSLNGYTRVEDMTETDAKAIGRPLFPGEQAIYYQYGSFLVDDSEMFQTTLGANSSREYDALHTMAYQEMPEKSLFRFVSELATNNSDLGFRLTGMNSVLYANPVDDPMFSAHREIVIASQQGDSLLYGSDFPGSAMACTVQHQYCLNNQQCTDLGPARQPSDLYKLLPEANGVQKAILALLAQARDIRAVYDSNNYQADESRGGYPFIESLPDDQWVRELKRWESAVWAVLQIAIRNYATGLSLSEASEKQIYTQAKTEGEKKLCGMQKMRKPGGFVNINFFGLVFTTVMSGVIVAIDLILLRSLLHLRKYKPWLGRRVDRWLQDGVFQLQRRAHEAHGSGIWKDLSEEVPVTTEKILLPELPFETLPEAQSSAIHPVPQMESEKAKSSPGIQIEEIFPLSGSSTFGSDLVETESSGSGKTTVESGSRGKENV